MGMYESFARVYDAFMDDVPYDAWCGRLQQLLGQNGIRDGLVLDLGCGTGSVTRRLSEAGYDMIGVDSSSKMLEIAAEKISPGILYLQQDMRAFELYGTVRAVISACDSLNYITSEEDLLKVFRLVNNYLDPGGLFLFDMNTIWKYRTLLGDGTFAENRDGCSYIWENTWYEDEMVNEYDLTLFVRQENGLYRRYAETHFQRAFPPERVRHLLEEAGLAYMHCWDGYTGNEAREDSDRILFAAKEITKQG